MVDTKSKEIYGKMGLDASVFDGPKIDDDQLDTNASWLKAARDVYTMAKGEAPQLSNKDLSDWAKNYVDTYNSNSLRFADATRQVMGATAEQKSAFLYLTDLKSHTTLSRGDVWNSAKAMAWDPLTYLGIGTLGVGLAVKKGGQVAATQAGKAALRHSIMTSLKTTVITGAVEGTLSASTRDAADQSIRVSAGHQDSFSFGRFATSTAMGAGFGGVLGGAFGAAVPAVGALSAKVSPKINSMVAGAFTKGPIGTVSQKVYNTAVKPIDAATDRMWARIQAKLGGNAGTGNTAPSAAKHSSKLDTGPHTPDPNKVIPAPQRSWMHKVIDYNPYIQLKSKFMYGGSNPSKYLPMDMAMGKFIRPMINALDDKILGKNLPDIFKNLDNSISKISDDLKAGKLTPQEAGEKSLRTYQEFLNTHAEELKSFEDSLTPLIREIQFEKELADIYNDLPTGKIRLKSNLEAGSKISSAEDLADAAITKFETDTGIKVDRDAIHKNIQGKGQGRFYLTNDQAEAMLDYANDLQGTMRNLRDPNKFGKDIVEAFTTWQNKDSVSATEMAEGLSALFEKPISFSANAIKRIADRDLNNLVDVIPDAGLPLLGTWRNWAGIKSRQYNLEDTDALFRQLDVGYYNPFKRKTKAFSGSAENAERNAMKIESFDGSKSDVSKLASIVEDSYKFGNEWEVLYAVRNLKRRVGMGDDTLPEDLVKQLDPAPKRQPQYVGDDHYNRFMRALDRVAAGNKQSPMIYGQRHVEQLYAENTFLMRYGRRFLGTNHIATPFKATYWINPKYKVMQSKIGELMGAKTTFEQVEFNRPKMTRHWIDPLPTDTKLGFGGKISHYSLGAAKSAGRAAWGWATLPFYPGTALTNAVVKNPTFRKAALTTSIVGGVGIGIEEGIEAYTGKDTDLDLGSRTIGGVLKVTDLAMAPMRWNAQLGELGYEAWTGNKAQIFGQDFHSLISTQPLMDLNRRYLGDRGRNDGAKPQTATDVPATAEEPQVPPFADKSGVGAHSLPEANADAGNGAPQPSVGRISAQQIQTTDQRIARANAAIEQKTFSLEDNRVAVREAEVNLSLGQGTQAQIDAAKEKVSQTEAQIKALQGQTAALAEQRQIQAIRLLVQDHEGRKPDATREQKIHYLRIQSVLETLAKKHPNTEILSVGEQNGEQYFVFQVLAAQMAENDEWFDDKNKLTDKWFGTDGASALKQAIESGALPTTAAAASGASAAAPTGQDSTADTVVAVDTTNANQPAATAGSDAPQDGAPQTSQAPAVADAGQAAAPAAGNGAPSAKAAADNAFSSNTPVTEHLGNLAGHVGQAATSAYTFDGSMPDSLKSVFGAVGGTLSGVGRVASNFFGDMFDNKITGGRWWLSAGIGVAGALMAGSMVKNIPILKHIPLGGLIVAFFALPLIMKGSKGIMDGMAGGASQGSGNYTPDALRATTDAQQNPVNGQVQTFQPANDDAYAAQTSGNNFADRRMLADEAGQPANDNQTYAPGQSRRTNIDSVTHAGNDNAPVTYEARPTADGTMPAQSAPQPQAYEPN